MNKIIGKENHFFRQFKVLAWKNFLLKKRQKVTLLLEIMIPVIIILLVGLLQTVIEPTVIEAYLPSGADWSDLSYSVPFEEQYGYQKFNCYDERNLVKRCSCTWEGRLKNRADWNTPLLYPEDINCERMNIAVLPDDANNADAITAVNDYVDFMNNISYNASLFQTFIKFDSEEQLLETINGKLYSWKGPIFSSAVIFKQNFPNWDYQIRMNYTYSEQLTRRYLPKSSVPPLDIALKRASQNTGRSAGEPYLNAYVNGNYFSLVDTVNSFIATKTCELTAFCVPYTEKINLRMNNGVAFPNEYAETTGFWGAIGATFALLMIISLLYPLSNVIKSLVEEKESKLREGMYMMALRGDSLYLSWIVNFLALFIPLSFLLTIFSGNLFRYSDSSLIFLYFLTFFMSSTSYCIFISTFFSKARTAAIMGCLLFFGGFFIYSGVESGNTSKGELMLCMMHPATAFTFGTLSFVEFEDAQIGVTSFTWNTSNKYPITFKDCIIMMLVDVIWLGFVSWYISQVWPSEFGTHKKWYFIFEPSYWIALGRAIIGLPPIDPRSYSQANATDDENNIELNDFMKEKEKYEEDVDENLKSQVDSKLCVTITNLFKGFQTPTGFKAAVDGLSLTMYSSQITALLGHNGAGKSTAISMLTGLYPPDRGTAVINGYDICTDMDFIRGNLGVCPQHDILFPDLTVLEHLTMFASFKGVPKDELENEVNKMILSIGLTEKKNEYSKFLSGGQKRKLSVGIAFIGGSKIVFLDEPTSGMDPYSRRFTWNVIRQYKEGRVVVLTTHFMDEADLLGDRIAIMGDGQLKCVGSSLFLKNIFGVGYNMTLEKKSAISFDSNKVVNLIASHVPECNVLTDVGTELTVQLPFSSSDKFQTLFEYIDVNIDTLGLQSYGISVTTLEEVFIKIANGTSTQKLAENGKSDKILEKDEIANAEDDTCDKILGKERNAEDKRSVKPSDVKIPKTRSFKKINEDNQYAYFFQHIYAMITKRRLYFVRDTKAWIYQYFVPILFVLTGSLITYFTFPYQYQPPLSYDVHSIYNQGIDTFIMPTPYTSNSSVCQTNYFMQPPIEFCRNAVSPLSLSQEWNQSGIMNSVPDNENLPLHSGENMNTILDMSTYLQNSRNDFKASHFGAISFNAIYETANTLDPNKNDITINYNIHANYSALHAGPIFNNILVSGVLRKINPDATLKTGLYVFPLTTRQETIYTNFNVDLIVTFILLAAPFIPAAISTYIVREREVKTKHQQIVSGISIPAYWLSNWIFDFVSFIPTVIMIVILLCAFPDTELLTGPTEIWATIMILLLFGTSISGFSYILSFVFDTPASAQIGMLFLNFVLGLIMNIAGIVFRFIPSTREVYFSTIRYIFMLFPAFAVGEGLHNLALIDVYSNFELDGGALYNVYDWEIVGMSITFLAIQSVVFLGSTILYEYLSAQPAIQQLFDMHTSLPTIDVSDLKDSDVLEEERAVLANEKEDSTILVKDFKKIFPPNHTKLCKKAQYDSNGVLLDTNNYGKYAVRGLSVGIPNGECFGLLGINGAGKSTTLSMLSGEFRPTSGNASVAGRNLLTDIHSCRRKIGFCPQFDALFELLTAREHLELYARIKGIVEEDIKTVVATKISEMGLTEYADRPAGTYSGGNKRKLSVAMAMIGEPSIVFLDEPSTGMDPVARRFMWEVISDIVIKREKCSLILTTHSMEECEALCTRIGIMVGGVMRCLGSAQRLRSRYGHGYQIEFGFVIPSQNQITAQVEKILTPSTLGRFNEYHLLDYDFTRDEMISIFAANNKNHWIDRIAANNNGAEIQSIFDLHDKISVRVLSSWWLNEESFDLIINFLNTNFGNFIMRERQTSKVRVEISASSMNGDIRRLSYMFGIIESNRNNLFIDDYSISQTSLEQIFNYFAQQQEEEISSDLGISVASINSVPSDANNLENGDKIELTTEKKI